MESYVSIPELQVQYSSMETIFQSKFNKVQILLQKLTDKHCFFLKIFSPTKFLHILKFFSCTKFQAMLNYFFC